MPYRFLNEDEAQKLLLWAGTGFAAMFTNLDIVLKGFIGVATLIYLILKIQRELREKKADKLKEKEEK